jgi:cohesin loading factor subunit SCC2
VHFFNRDQDTGVGVRKRVIKLLKSFYGVSDNASHRINISTRLILRMLDDDETVRDLAIKAMEELWFQGDISSTCLQKSRSSVPTGNRHDKGPLLAKVAVIMGVSANFRDRQSPLEEMLRKIMVDKDGKEASLLHASYAEICGTLIDGLVDASDLPGFVRSSSVIILLPFAYIVHLR